jgi:hypothetical protein
MSSINIRSARRILATCWLLGSALPFTALAYRSMFGQNGATSSTKDMWSWLLPMVVPTCSLMLGVVIADAQNTVNVSADVFLFFLTLSLSIFYLGMVLFVLVGSAVGQGAVIDTLKGSSIFLGPLQGLAAGCIAAFFQRSKAPSHKPKKPKV